MDALSASQFGAYKNLYQQYCNRHHNWKTFTDLYNDIHDLVEYNWDGVKSSTPRDSDAEVEDSVAMDPGALKQVAGAVTRTAPTGKCRSSKQHLSVKHSNSQPPPQPTAESTTSHPTLVVDRRATRLASRAIIVLAPVTEPSGAHRPSVLRRTAARHLYPQTRGRPTLSKSIDICRSQRHHHSSFH